MSAEASGENKFDDSFDREKLDDVLEEMRGINGAASVLKELDKIPGEFHKLIILESIRRGYKKLISKYIDKFEGLDAEIAEKLIDWGQSSIVFKNLDSFDVFNIDLPSLFMFGLEQTGGDPKEIYSLLSASQFIEKKISIHLYVIRMFLLFPDKYRDLIGVLSKEGLDVDVYESYEKDIEDLRVLLNETSETEKLNTELPSFNLEIEAMNIDKKMELDTPITNNIDSLIVFVRKFDEIQEKIRSQITENLGDDKQLIGVYDSVHINIGLPGEIVTKHWVDEGKRGTGIYSLLDLIGLIYNSVGRSAYMAELEDDITMDSNKTALGTYKEKSQKRVLGGYNEKLQNRLWSFNFATKNAPMLEVMLRFMEGIIKEYRKDPQNGRAIVDGITDRIAKFIKQEEEKAYESIGEEPIYEMPITYGELIDNKRGPWKVHKHQLEGGHFPDAYLMDRTEILKFIMKELSEAIKST